MLGQCPNCKGVFEVQPEWIGQQAQCPYCKENIIIQARDNSEPTQPAENTQHNAQYGNNSASPALDAQTENSSNTNNTNTNYDDVASLGAFSCYLKAIKNYIGYSGRASRKEFCYFWLFNFIFGILAEGIHPILAKIYALAMFLPWTAILIRRLHDINKSGWHFFIPLILSSLFGLLASEFVIFEEICIIPLYVCAGWSLLVLISIFFRRGTIGPNKYGKDPYDAK